MVAARFGSAPPSCDRVHDHSVRVRSWAIAVAWGTIGWVRPWTIAAGSGVSRVGCAIPIARRGIRAVAVARRRIRGYRWAWRWGLHVRGRRSDIRLLGDRRRYSDVLLGCWGHSDRRSGSSSNGASSNRSSCYRAAVFAPMHSPINPSNARCRKGSSDFGFSCIRRE